MAVISWGKPKIWYAPLSSGTPGTWKAAPTPAEGTTTLTITKGDKKEAKIEGGEVEATRYSANTAALEFTYRGSATQGKLDGVTDVNGVIQGEYAIKLQPEDATAPGLYIPRGVLSLEPSYTAEDGIQYKYTLDALIPSGNDSNAVQFQVVTDPTSGQIPG
ncbi:MAG: hypothetical protein IKR17_02880 [Bacteroidales bacterium]|nr:hypothetical protein [Bacteroidales bacterium]